MVLGVQGPGIKIRLHEIHHLHRVLLEIMT